MRTLIHSDFEIPETLLVIVGVEIFARHPAAPPESSADIHTDPGGPGFFYFFHQLSLTAVYKPLMHSSISRPTSRFRGCHTAPADAPGLASINSCISPSSFTIGNGFCPLLQEMRRVWRYSGCKGGGRSVRHCNERYCGAAGYAEAAHQAVERDVCRFGKIAALNIGDILHYVNILGANLGTGTAAQAAEYFRVEAGKNRLRKA
jgi:hypothetical protein